MHDISWKCRYCGKAMAEGKLFAHEATCSHKPKVKMQMVKVGERAPLVKNKRGKRVAAISQA